MRQSSMSIIASEEISVINNTDIQYIYIVILPQEGT